MKTVKQGWLKRGLSAILAMVMLLALVPMAVFAESTLPIPTIEVSDITETGAAITMTRGDHDAYMYFVFYDVREKSAEPITEINFAMFANGEVKNASTDDFGSGKAAYVTVNE